MRTVDKPKTNPMTAYIFPPPAVQSLPIRGKTERFPINRLFFVGRNYHAHAIEMGKPVDKSVERPFYFTKSRDTRNPELPFRDGDGGGHWQGRLSRRPG